MRAYPQSGCAERACRNAGWTVQHTLVILTRNPSDAISKLYADTNAIRAHIREAYSEYLLALQDAVNVQLRHLGENHGYAVNAMVCIAPPEAHTNLRSSW